MKKKDTGSEKGLKRRQDQEKVCDINVALLTEESDVTDRTPG